MWKMIAIQTIHVTVSTMISIQTIHVTVSTKAMNNIVKMRLI